MAGFSGSERRRRQAAGIAGASLLLSLIGGILVLLFNPTAPTKTAIKKIQPPTTTVTVTPSAAPESTDLSMFGLGDNAALDSSPLGSNASSGVVGSSSAAMGGSSPGLVPGAPLNSLPQAQLPGTLDTPTDPGVDWNSLLTPIADAQRASQAAGVAGSVIGAGAGITSAAISSTAVIIGDLILYSAISNNGPAVLSQLQTALSAPAAAAIAPALTQAVPSADFSGLSTAFAAAAAAPPIGVPALPALPALPPMPQLPQLPPLPGLPTPEQVAGGLAALPALGGLAGFGIPQLPPPPQLPRPEEVVGGIAGLMIGGAIAGAVLGAFFQPPSLTKMMGLPF